VSDLSKYSSSSTGRLRHDPTLCSILRFVIRDRTVDDVVSAVKAERAEESAFTCIYNAIKNDLPSNSEGPREGHDSPLCSASSPRSGLL
jgi:hypothetical protein